MNVFPMKTGHSYLKGAICSSFISIVFLLLPLDLFCQHIFLPVVTPDNVQCSDSYSLIFDDEFTEHTLDLSKWRYGLSWTITDSNDYYGDSNCLVFTGNSVKLINIADPITYNGVTYPWRAGVISLLNSFPGTGGKVEIRARISEVGGTHPAFWLFGACRKEIDVFEFWANSQDDHTDLHATDPLTQPCNTPGIGLGKYVGNINPGEWHIFSVEWNNIFVEWKIDGNIVRTEYKYYYYSLSPVTECAPGNTNVLEDILLPVDSDKLELVLGNPVDDIGTSPSSFEISYVRGYSLINNSTENIHVVPNPSQGTFTLQIAGNTNQSLSNDIFIYDIFGRVVYQNTTSQSEMLVNLNTEKSGIYLIMVKNSIQFAMSKAIIIK